MERTLAIIKPDCVRSRVIGRVIHMIERAGFRILGIKELSLSKRDAEKFYEIHYGKPFYEGLVSFMNSGPVVLMALEKENAVEEYRKLIGATNPDDAKDGTVRARFGSNVQSNCVHGSDSAENGRKEVSFFFSDRELLYD